MAISSPDVSLAIVTFWDPKTIFVIRCLDNANARTVLWAKRAVNVAKIISDLRLVSVVNVS